MLVFFIAWKIIKRNSFIDLRNVDLRQDEYVDTIDDEKDDWERENRLRGKFGILWKMYYAVA